MSALDVALEMLADRAAEFGPGLSNHAPMAAEALVALGFDDEVAGWVDRYRPRLDQGREIERDLIEPDEWRLALGHPERIGDWNAYFARELESATVDAVLSTWLPRLAPGVMAAAAHGLLRTAHAVRAVEGQANELRTAELAAGLGYWAARYQELPSTPRPSGDLSAVGALARTPVIDESDRGAFLIFDQVKAVERLDGFGAAVDAFGQPLDPDEALDAVIDAATRSYLTCARRTEIAFIHTVTGPAALRALLPYIPVEQRHDAVAYAWQLVVAIRSAYAHVPPLEGPIETETPSWDDLGARALDLGDEHAIKMVEASRREHARSGAPSLVGAARRAVGLPVASRT